MWEKLIRKEGRIMKINLVHAIMLLEELNSVEDPIVYKVRNVIRGIWMTATFYLQPSLAIFA